MQSSSNSSSETLHDPSASLPKDKLEKHNSLEPEPPRNYRTSIDSLEREGEEAERAFAQFGGDVPESQVKIHRCVKKNVTRPCIGRTRSSSTNFPDLHLTDTAFSDAHRQMSRIYSRVLSESGIEVEIVQPPEDSNKVVWKDNDPENPQMFSNAKKWAITIMCSFLTVNVTFASSAPSSSVHAVATQFNSSLEVSTLSVTLFLLGYCMGPLLWAPFSEMVGRRPVFLGTMLFYGIFQILCALAPNMASLLVGRFLTGTFAAAPLTNCGAVLADLWDAVGRGPAMSLFITGLYLGTVVGPIVGGFVTTSYLTWRFVFWLMLILNTAMMIPCFFFIPETFAPVLLAKRAKAMRRAEPEKFKDVYAELERADFSFKSIVTRTCARPFVMLVKEPLLILVTLYISVVYSLLYSLLSVTPIVWGTLRGFNDGEVGLVFLGIGVGTVIGGILNVLVQRHYPALVKKWHGHAPPEERLWGAMIAGPPLVIGCFMLGWTGAYPSVHWIVPVIALGFIGTALTLVFISFLSYIIETYLFYAASALAANTILRSAIAAAFPLFTRQMYAKLGVNWACSLMGFISILLLPIPFFFYKYGAKIRDGSSFAPCLDLHLREQVEREEKEQRDKAPGSSV